jgi:hypothetical protein
MFSEITEDDDNGWNPWGEEFEKEGSYLHRHQPPKILWNREDIKSDNSTLFFKFLTPGIPSIIIVFGYF